MSDNLYDDYYENSSVISVSDCYCKPMMVCSYCMKGYN